MTVGRMVGAALSSMEIQPRPKRPCLLAATVHRNTAALTFTHSRTTPANCDRSMLSAWGRGPIFFRTARTCFSTAEDELLSIDAATGRENWKFASGVSNDDLLVKSSPALSHGRVFFGGMNGMVYAVDENSGRVIWKRDLGLRVSTALAVLGDSVYLGTIANRLYRLAADTGA